MENTFANMMTMDEWRFLHSFDMYYTVYGSKDSDPEAAALAARRKVLRELEWENRRQ